MATLGSSEGLIFIRSDARSGTGFELLEAAVAGLSKEQKSLPCRFLYDAKGSELFERITRLPEYYLTRTEMEILEQHAAQIISAAGEEIDIVEFGSGSSRKTRVLLEAALDRQTALRYLPIDISDEFLRASSEALISDYENLSIVAIAGEYRHGIQVLPATDLPRLILFLGSNIGNFEHEEAVDFLRLVSTQMAPQDRLLIGADIVKDREIIRAAYDDSSGVTSEFSKNILTRINHELGADFDPDKFRHSAPFIEETSRVEMHLVCEEAHSVFIQAALRTFDVQEGESIRTEYSHKYSPQGFQRLCGDANLHIQQSWTDEREWFRVFLLKPDGLSD